MIFKYINKKILTRNKEVILLQFVSDTTTTCIHCPFLLWIIQREGLIHWEGFREKPEE